VVPSLVARLTAPIVLIALFGCDQSLFDEGVDDDPGQTDDGDDGDTSDDGSGDDTADDGADDGGDDGGTDVCPAPCQGDPVEDFNFEQGGANGRWSYLAQATEVNGAGFQELTQGSFDGVDAFVLVDDIGPAILRCTTDSSAAVCAGVGDSMVLIPTADDPTQPALGFRAPSNGTYRLIGSFRLPDGYDEGVQQQFLVSRNSRDDLLSSSVYLTSVEPATLSVDVDALAGDQVLLSLLPSQSAGSGPIAFSFGVTLLGGEDIFPGRCMFAATFEDDGLEDACGGANLENLNDGGKGGPGLTEPGESVNQEHGGARVFRESQYIRSTGAPMDYRGDFTVQYWSRLDEPQASFSTVPFADRHGLARGGVIFVLDDVDAFMQACYMWDDGTDPPDPLSACIVGEPPRDGMWHFTRLSRSAESGRISLCIDGVLQGSDTAPGAFDMSTDQAPHMGRNVDFEPAYFGGSLDDVRVIRRALPCPTVAP